MFRRTRAIKDGLTKTRKGFFGQIASLLVADEITDELWEGLEELLILADVGVAATVELKARMNSIDSMFSCPPYGFGIQSPCSRA